MKRRPRRAPSQTYIHEMALYENRRHLYQLITPYVRNSLRGGGICSFVTSHPAQDRRFLAREIKRAGIRRQVGPYVNDARKLLVESRSPLDSFTKLWDRMEEEYEPKPHQWVNIGSFLHEFYPRFEVGLDLERHLASRKPKASVLCCYSNEGFSSLNPKLIAEVCQLHDRVLFPNSVF